MKNTASAGNGSGRASGVTAVAERIRWATVATP